MNDYWQPHAKLIAYPALAGIGLLAAVVTSRPELVGLVLPFAAVALGGLVTARPLAVAVDVTVEPAVAFEGDEVEVRVMLRSDAGVAVATVELGTGPQLSRLGPGPAPVRVPAGGEATVTARYVCRRWGAYRPGRFLVHLADRTGAFRRTVEVRAPVVLRVHPPTERLRTVLAPGRVGAFSGAHRAAGRAEGIEYADTRPFVTGDRTRAMNWRVSARLGGWWVDDRHPDRAGDLVLFIDSFAETGDESGLDSTLGIAVRTAMALARRHLGVHDRLGMVGLGGVVHWVTAGVGRRQLHTVVDAILDSEIIASEAEKGVDVVPVRALPPRATVIAITPLLDPRSLRFLLELRGRGHDVAVVECAAEEYHAPASGATGSVAWAWWTLERDEQRRRLRDAGASIATLGRNQPVEAVVSRLLVARRRGPALRLGRAR